ncbi:hypothetical protein [Nocardia sp. alder85J]|uniref:hypothetical protein n=1 Tax=Nocardia sp. alder85J TaxID=2862949 RepID=UPI001CD2235E|nr:hypothetical protein [Nocardia sp. alder85J]MCX4096513.1 hypothetical protein [Nocardia sp. alder85J]
MTARSVPQPPYSADLLADLHADNLAPDVSDRLWPLVRDDPEAERFLRSLDDVSHELHRLGADPLVLHPMPTRVATRLDRMLDALAAGTDPATLASDRTPAERTSGHGRPVAGNHRPVVETERPTADSARPMAGSGPPASGGGRSVIDDRRSVIAGGLSAVNGSRLTVDGGQSAMDGELPAVNSELPAVNSELSPAVLPFGPPPAARSARGLRPRWGAAAAAAAVALVAGGLAAVAAVHDRPATTAASGAATTTPSAPAAASTGGLSRTALLDALGRDDVSGPLSRPDALTACVAAAGLDRTVLGAVNTGYQGDPAVLILLAGPQPPTITALVVGPGCRPGDPQLLETRDIG